MKVENKITPNEDQINGFLEDPELGPISMVNLLKYKEEMWDAVAIAKYPNRKAMMDMTMDPGYQKIHVHRVAGLDGQLNIETIDK